MFNSDDKHKKRVKELEKVLKSHIWKLGKLSANGYRLKQR
jgi:hypothetical protein